MTKATFLKVVSDMDGYEDDKAFGGCMSAAFLIGTIGTIGTIVIVGWLIFKLLIGTWNLFFG